MSASARKPTLRLFDYYLIEGMSSFAATIFLLGIFFWARARYGFSNTENLVLGATQGLAHMLSSRFGGGLGDRWGYNRILITGLSIICVISLTLWTINARWLPYVAMGAYSAAIALTWPALEGGAMHLPGRFNMPQRLGIFNLVWSITGALGFIVSGFLFEWKADAIFWFPGLIHAAQLVWITWQRGRHEITGSAAMAFAHHGDHQSPAVKKEMTAFSWLSNSLGYFLVGGFSALTPHLGEKFGISASWTIWLGCSLLVARAGSFVLLYRWQGWHYHRGWGHYALWSSPLWLAAAFFADHLAVVVIGCILFGFSLGLSYYMSIYYSLDANDNKGQQGGFHEAVIGLGIMAGPLAGAAGGYLSGTTMGAKATLVTASMLIAMGGSLWIRYSLRRG